MPLIAKSITGREGEPAMRRTSLQRIAAASALLWMMFTAAGAVQKSESVIQLEFGVKVARMGSWREAAFRFERAVKADDGNARAWNNLGVARESLGDFASAREAYEKSLALAPDDRRIRQNYERFMSLSGARTAPSSDAAGPASQP